MYNVKKQVSLLLCFVLILCCASCQKTPDAIVIVNKNDGKLEETIMASPAPMGQKVEAVSWKEVMRFSRFICEIDIETKLPDTGGYPALRVQKSGFDSEYFKSLTGYFANGATGIRVTSDTKEDLERQLLTAQMGEYIMDDSGGRWVPYEGQQDDIKRLKEQIKNAQEEAFEKVDEYSFGSSDAHTFLMSDGSKVYVNAKADHYSYNTDKNVVMQPESWVINGFAIADEPAGTLIENIVIKQEEAQNKASDLIDALNIKNMGIATVEKARLVYTIGDSAQIPSAGWCVTFARNDGNSTPISFNSMQLSGILLLETDDYAESWSAESITVYVDESGVREFVWDNPITVTETLNSNVKLMSFDTIKEMIRRALKYGCIQADNAGRFGDGSKKITVSNIALTNVIVPIKDDMTSRVLLPAWIVYYTLDDGYDDSISVFAINAVDGSIIDLELRR